MRNKQNVELHHCKQIYVSLLAGRGGLGEAHLDIKIQDAYLSGWAHFRPTRKESLLGWPEPGLDLGKGGWIKSCLCKPGVREDVLLIWDWLRPFPAKEKKESSLEHAGLGLDLGEGG